MSIAEQSGLESFSFFDVEGGLNSRIHVNDPGGLEYHLCSAFQSSSPLTDFPFNCPRTTGKLDLEDAAFHCERPARWTRVS
jgi:hypothetical protein